MGGRASLSHLVQLGQLLGKPHAFKVSAIPKLSFSRRWDRRAQGIVRCVCRRSKWSRHPLQNECQIVEGEITVNQHDFLQGDNPPLVFMPQAILALADDRTLSA